MRIWPGILLDFAVSGECESLLCNLLGNWGEHWLKDCLNRYEAPIDSLEYLTEIRAWMHTESPRWRREPGNGGIVWMSGGHQSFGDSMMKDLSNKGVHGNRAATEREPSRH